MPPAAAPGLEPAEPGRSYGAMGGLAYYLPVGPTAWLGAVVLWVTRAPFLPRRGSWSLTLGPPSSVLEVGGNFLLLLPLALLLAAAVERRFGGRRPQILLWLLLLGACVLIEAGQVFLRDRLISPYDLVLNLAGASLGQWMGARIGSRPGEYARPAIYGGGTVLALVYVGLGLLLWTRAGAVQKGFRIQNWNPSHRIVIGDEVGGERAYRGVVKQAWICAPEAGDPVCATQGADSGKRRRLVQSVERIQSVRLEGTVRSSSSRQEGPSRIITFSNGPDFRNATLGQSGDDLVLRVRTPLSGPNGTEAIYRLSDAVPVGMETDVMAAYRTGRVRLAAATGDTVRSATYDLTSEWLSTSVVAGRIDPSYPKQPLWAGLAGVMLVVFPVGWAAGWSVASQGRGLSLALGTMVGLLLLAMFAARVGTRPGPAVILGAAGGAAVGGLAGVRDRRTWWSLYTR